MWKENTQTNSKTKNEFWGKKNVINQLFIIKNQKNIKKMNF